MPLTAPKPAFNIPGLVGLGMVVLAAIFSPTGFCGLPLLFLVPMGFGGLIVCAVGVFFKPRWPAVTGLILGIATLIFWFGFFGWTARSVHNQAAQHGMTIVQHTGACMAAMMLADTVESQRRPDGTLPAVADLSTLTTTETIDPWGNAYRYTLVVTPRGYTFMSDGPDRTQGTADDVDIFTIQHDGMFPLPAITSPATPSTATAPPTSTQPASTPAPDEKR